MTKNRVYLMVLHESFAQSAAKDVMTFGSIVASISIGVWLGSGALQWIAGLMMLVWGGAKMSKSSRRCNMTPTQAAKYIKDKFGVSA